MYNDLPESLSLLIDYLKHFPAVGERSAFRMALFLIGQPPEFAESFGNLMLRLSREVGLCPLCFNISTQDQPCIICADTRRDPTRICVVQTVPDLIAMSDGAGYRGRFFVLHGLLSPIKGVGPVELRFEHLMKRIREDGVEEVIVATDFSVEGDATALYIARILNAADVQLSRIAAGIPSGSSIEYLDHRTLRSALDERRDFSFDD